MNSLEPSQTATVADRKPYCDLHPSYPLQHRVMETLSPAGDRDTLACFGCTRPTCHRYYYCHFGYFNAPPDQALDLGDPAAKPRCRKHDVQLFMYVQKTEAGWRHACPDPACTSASPFGNTVTLSTRTL